MSKDGSGKKGSVVMALGSSSRNVRHVRPCHGGISGRLELKTPPVRLIPGVHRGKSLTDHAFIPFTLEPGSRMVMSKRVLVGHLTESNDFSWTNPFTPNQLSVRERKKKERGDVAFPRTPT
jgi:hypothetical protein